MNASPKLRGEMLLISSVRRGAKKCNSARSRQELSNEYLAVKFRCERAENEPLKLGLNLSRLKIKDNRRLKMAAYVSKHLS